MDAHHQPSRVVNRVISFIILFIMLISFVSSEKLAEFDLTIYKNNTAQIDNMRAYEGRIPYTPGIKSPYLLRTIDKSNKVAATAPLYIAFYTLDADPPRPVDSVPVTAAFEYDTSWKLLQVYNKQQLVLQEDIEDYFCNSDSFCGIRENYISCPQDCPSGSTDGWCDRVKDSICDQDCLPNIDPDCKSSTLLLIITGLAILIILILIILIIIRKRKKQVTLSQPQVPTQQAQSQQYPYQ